MTSSVERLTETIDRAAERDAEHDAFRTPESTLTYGDLVRRANGLAHLLCDEGVRRGDRVGIFMPRSIESALAVYGILKAGAAFVPIDPHMPAGGVRHLVDVCAIHHLVTQPSQGPVLASLPPGQTSIESIVGLETGLDIARRTHPWNARAALDADAPPPVSVATDDLAYIMFSSGSTGRPKGISHTHASGASYAALSVDTYDVRPDDVIGNHSPLHFDMSTFGYFSGPLAGATTTLIPEAHTKLTASLSQLMESERMTIWYSVPLALIQLLERGVLESRDLTALRWVLFGGEPFPMKHLSALMRRWPHARFSNVYGPAEVNQCTYYHVPPLAADDACEESIPIGRVWDSAEGLVLDDDDEPVANGEIGELLVHAPTMMRGYWGRPDLDERAFFRHRDSAGAERRFYRTGDLVRVLGDGNLQFIGRKDRQMKVRGYRVELDEVEHMLTTHDGVQEAAVFPVRVGEEVSRLEAAVTVAGAPAPTPEALVDFASRVLSWYAVPGQIRVLDALPRTATDKIDRRRLQAEAERREATL